MTDKQKLFCLYYVKSFNATAAYLKAYKNVSYDTARNSCCRLLANDCIKNEIKRLKKELTNELEVEAIDVIKEFTKIAFSDMGDFIEWHSKEETFYNEDGEEVKRPKNYIIVKDSKKVDTSLIQEITNGKNGFKIKLLDKVKALGILAQYFNITEDGQTENKEAKKFIVEYVKKDDSND